MEKFLPVLEKCPLFSGIEPENLQPMLACLGARVSEYAKHAPVFMEGDPARQVGVLLSGSAQVVKDDFYGNRSIVTGVAPGQLFGESFACAGLEHLPVSVIAVEKSEIMLIDCRRITMTCSNACSFHNRMVLNMLKVVAAKNLVFHQKMEIISQRSTREKLMCYLLNQAKEAGSNEFTIPFDRQALADYLGVERSALSAEISKLRSDGVLESSRSSFKLL